MVAGVSCLLCHGKRRHGYRSVGQDLREYGNEHVIMEQLP